MAENKSIFSKGESGMTRGGLDRYLGPQGGDFSSLPEEIENPDEKADDTREVDCAGNDKDEAVCQIADAEKAKEAESATKERRTK